MERKAGSTAFIWQSHGSRFRFGVLSMADVLYGWEVEGAAAKEREAARVNTAVFAEGASETAWASLAGTA